MSAFTASLDDAVTEYSRQPGNFGADSEALRIASGDGFRAGAEWANAHIDWRVLGGLIPGMIEARYVRLGDRVRLTGGLSTVVGVRLHGRPGYVYITARSGEGAEITDEIRATARVHVERVGQS